MLLYIYTIGGENCLTKLCYLLSRIVTALVHAMHSYSDQKSVYSCNATCSLWAVSRTLLCSWST